MLTSNRPKRSESERSYCSRSGEDGGRSSADACGEDGDLSGVIVEPLPELLAEVGFIFLGEVIFVLLAIGRSGSNHQLPDLIFGYACAFGDFRAELANERPVRHGV